MVTYYLVIKNYIIPPIAPLLITVLEGLAKQLDKRKKAKLSWFADDMIVYLGHPRESKEKLLEK